MKHSIILATVLAVCAALIGCTPRNTLTRQAQAASYRQVADTPDQPLDLALAYFREGSYQKSADYFEQAANMYRDDRDKDGERRAITAAAKVHLKCSQRDRFLMCAYRLDRLIGRWEMPSDDERTLLNIAAVLQGYDLPYPVKEPAWRTILTN